MRNKAGVAVGLLLGAVVGTLSFWTLHKDADRKFDALKKNALCVLDLPEGTSSTSATFTNSRPIDKFHVGTQTKDSDGALSVSISGDSGVVCSVSRVKASSFGLGKGIQPGNYTVTLGQENKGKGGTVVIADAAPIYVTGWQIWSRTYVGVLTFSGICMVLLRKAEHSKTRALSLTAFHSLLLGFVLMFVYLLFHEGGHALAEMAFGRFDFARSDFWGIHGHPHSAGNAGPQLQPWQQTLISCAGPMLPTIVGFGLFVLWVLPPSRKLRSSQPMLNLYFSAIVAMLVFPEAVCGPAYLLGLIRAEGDLIGHFTTTGGPVWLVKGLLASTFLICVLILWKVGPEIPKTWWTRFVGPWKSVSHPPRV